MLQGYATTEGTFTYAKRFPKFSKDFFSPSRELFVSSLGIGTFMPEPYKEENYTFSLKDSVVEAVMNGSNMIDTAINYRYRQSEREVGEALNELLEKGFERDELILASKAGFLPLDFPFPKDPYVWIRDTVINPGLASKEEVIDDQYCLSPAYLEWSLEESLKNLDIETLDIFYLHNPEVTLGTLTYDELLQAIEAAFELFEKKVAEGKIRSYGIATWNAFLYQEGDLEYLSLQDIVAIARKAGGKEHHFRYVQMPFNLGKPHAYNYPNQKGPDGRYYTVMQAAKGLGLDVVVSSSLLQMNLFKKPFTQETVELLGLKDMTDIHCALQFARSGGAVSALFGSHDPEHVKGNLLLGYLPKTDQQNYQKLFGF